MTLTPTTLSIAKKVFTVFAVVKYLFFPYVSAYGATAGLNATGTRPVIEISIKPGMAPAIIVEDVSSKK